MLSIHFVPKFHRTISDKNLHTFVIQSTRFTSVHHEYIRYSIKRSNTLPHLISCSDILHLFKTIHQLDPVNSTFTSCTFSGNLRNIMRVSFQFFICGFPKRLHRFKVISINTKDTSRDSALRVSSIHVIIHSS